MYEFKLSGNPSTEDTLAILNKWGIVYLPGYLNSTDTAKVKNEFHILLEHQADWIRPIEYSLGKGVCVNRERMEINKFPITAKIFGSTFMEVVTNCYLGHQNLLNHEIYVVKDVVGSSHIAQDLHYDRIPTLKFFIYLTDTTVKNGAFDCVPGSHTYTRAIQKQNRQSGVKPNLAQTRVLPPEIAQKTIPIEGPAGTLIIFHTDVFHRAGIVKEGERLVMRGHSRLVADWKPQVAPKFSLQWWRESARKPLKKYLSKIS